MVKDSQDSPLQEEKSSPILIYKPKRVHLQPYRLVLEVVLEFHELVHVRGPAVDVSQKTVDAVVALVDARQHQLQRQSQRIGFGSAGQTTCAPLIQAEPYPYPPSGSGS